MGARRGLTTVPAETVSFRQGNAAAVSRVAPITVPVSPSQYRRPFQAARCRLNCAQMSESAPTRCSTSSSVWKGEGVKRSRSVPRGTVG